LAGCGGGSGGGNRHGGAKQLNGVYSS
jgi:hypothetical protein